MAGIDLLEDSSQDLVSRAEEGDFFRTAGSFRKGEKERWEKDLDLVQRICLNPLFHHSVIPIYSLCGLSVLRRAHNVQ